MTRVEVRTAGLADVDAVLELWSAAADNGRRPPDTAAAVVALLGRDPAALLVAEDSAGLFGSVIAGWDGWRGHSSGLRCIPAVAGEASAQRCSAQRR